MVYSNRHSGSPLSLDEHHDPLDTPGVNVNFGHSLRRVRLPDPPVTRCHDTPQFYLYDAK